MQTNGTLEKNAIVIHCRTSHFFKVVNPGEYRLHFEMVFEPGEEVIYLYRLKYKGSQKRALIHCWESQAALTHEDTRTLLAEYLQEHSINTFFEGGKR